jgi:glycosyltransferase involved in cell wall biosynthesis
MSLVGRTLGMYYDHEGAAGPVNGGVTANATFLNALVRYGNFDNVALYASPFNLERSKDRVTGLVAQHRTNKNVFIRSETELGNRECASQLSIWYQGQATVHSALNVRRAVSSKMFPITSQPHTLWTNRLPEQWASHLLLGGHAPYDSVICSTKTMRDVFVQMIGHVATELERAHGVSVPYKGRTDVVPFGLDLEVFRPLDKASCRGQLGIEPDAFVILSFGRFSAIGKGDLLPLLRTFRELVSSNKQLSLHLILAGVFTHEDPGLDKALPKFIAELGLEQHVRVIVDLPLAQRAALYGAADLFVGISDSIVETFGLTVIEAMACGIPQIVSDWDGYKETVEHGVTGFRVPTYWTPCADDLASVPFVLRDWIRTMPLLAMAQSVVIDTNHLRDAIQELITNTDLRREMSARSVRVARERFSDERMIRNYESVWEDCLEMADRIEFRPPPAAFLNPYYPAFESYPSTMLDPESVRVRITQTGRSVVENRAPFPPMYLGMERLVIDQRLIWSALEVIATEGGCLISTAVTGMVRDHHVHEAKARRHVMTALKHGWIELEHRPELLSLSWRGKEAG